MLRGFHAELRRLLLFAGLCVVLGLLLGYLLKALLLGAVLYITWLLWQMRRLNRWLLRQGEEAPPEASGIWGEVFDNIYRLQRHQQREKQNLQAVVTRIQETTSALRDGVILLNWRGHLDWWNPSAQRLLGFRVSDRGQPVANFIRHPRFIKYFDEGDYSEPLSMPSPRFASRRLQFQITRFGHDERLIVVRDITQLHNLEQMRKDFVANVSHELRTPLTVISGYLETLEDSPDVKPAWRKPLEQMQQQTRRMTLLINDLLMLSKLETSESGHNHRPLDLALLLQQVSNEALALSREKQQEVVLQLQPGQQVTGSEKELHSAFSNLLVNAIKYTQSGGRIELRLWREHNHIHVCVSDNGPGFEAKHIPHLTERFYRVEASRNSSTGGTGLGLAIVKHVLLRHDAELLIRSTPGQGSSFTCVFPVA